MMPVANHLNARPIFVLLVAATALAVLAPAEAHATGGNRPVVVASPAPSEPADSQAFPVRLLRFDNFTTAPFRLSDGRDVSMGNDVHLMVETKVNESQHFRTIADNVPNPALAHGVLLGGVSAMVFDVASLGIKFGYRFDSNGNAQPVNEGGGTRLTGELTVHVGQLALDFSIVDPLSGRTWAATSVTQDMLNLNINIKINFDALEIGPEFIWSQPLRDAIQKCATEAMRRLSAAPDINLMAWSTKVLGVDAVKKLVFFQANLADHIAPGNNFEVYSHCTHEDCFQLYLGDIKALRVGSQNTEAKVKNDASGEVLRTIEAGDRVYIRYLPRP